MVYIIEQNFADASDDSSGSKEGEDRDDDAIKILLEIPERSYTLAKFPLSVFERTHAIVLSQHQVLCLGRRYVRVSNSLQ